MNNINDMDINSAIESMKHEELVELYSLFIEKEISEKTKGREYKANRGQDPFHKSNKPFRLIMGSNRSGKTECCTQELYWYASGTHPYRKVPSVPNIGKVVSGQGFVNGILRVIEPKIKTIFPSKFISKCVYNKDGALIKIICSNGSIIYFASGGQDISDAVEGDTYHYAWIDEPVPYEFFVGIMRGLIDNSGDLLMSLTATLQNKNTGWIFDYVYDKWEEGDPLTKKYWDVFHINMEDNLVENGGVLTRESIERYSSILSEDELDVRVKGSIKRLTGRCYPMFKESTHVINPFLISNKIPVYRGIDPHPNKANSVVWHAFINPNWYVIKELDSDFIGDYDTLAKQCVDIERANDYYVIDAIVDPSLNREDKRGGGKNQLNILNRAFIDLGARPCRMAVKFENLVPGVMTVAKALEDNRLFVFNTCPKWIKEAKLYRWDKDKAIPVDKWNDKLDPTRYVLHAFSDIHRNKCEVIKADFDRETYGLEKLEKKKKGFLYDDEPRYSYITD